MQGETYMVKAIVGANWGDEGKGKITDMLSAKSDLVVRFQGGANAGHTIINNFGKFALHSLPSGVFYPHIQNIIGQGVALHIDGLLAELEALTARSVPAPNLLVSDRAQVMMPYHILFDTYEEDRLAERSFGSTKSGIAPFYADKYAKIGFQVCELFDEELVKTRLKNVCEVKNVLLKHLYNKPLLDFTQQYDDLMRRRDAIAPYLGDGARAVQEAVQAGKTVLLEGQLGALKDPDFGIYPFVTSSHTVAGFGAIGAGVAPHQIGQIIAVTKAYSSAVGQGAFVSEIFGEEAETLRRLGGDAGEYGATTGRPRRVGWFDAIATRYGCHAQGATELVLTAIDVLSYLDEIQVCTGYEMDGKITKHFPAGSTIDRAKPVYETLPGWKVDMRGVTDYDKFPENAKRYVEFIEKQVGVPIKIVSTGPKREEIALRNPVTV